MGAGIALECRYRYPKMFEQYRKLCDEGRLEIGLLWLYKGSDHWILNFPTKRKWKDVSRPEYLHAGLRKFEATYRQKKIESIAFPLLGAQHGGLAADQVIEIMLPYLRRCEILVEIYRYDPLAPDDKYSEFKRHFLALSDVEVKDGTGIRIDIVKKIRDALSDDGICQLNQLASVKGVGDKTLEKAFQQISNLVKRDIGGAPNQLLF
jgi:hypothetical protein